MLNPIESRRDPFDPAVRGYHAVYRENEVNHCPGCGRTHWYLGRMLAECAFCGTALPLHGSVEQRQLGHGRRAGARGRAIRSSRRPDSAVISR